jgi:hypothetical protein
MSAMDVENLREMGPENWPDNAGASIKSLLRDRRAGVAKRLTAVELAGEEFVWDDDLAEALMAIVASREEPDELRARAAIAFGPIIEETEMEGFDEDDPFSEPRITEETFKKVQETLHRVYADESDSKEVRRRALEGSVRGVEKWHRDAVGAAYASSDPEWRITGVFGMRYAPGFDAQILEALESDDPEMHFEAVRAAGEREVKAAWPHIAALLNEKKEKDLLLAAIEAAAYINAEEAVPALVKLSESEDAEIAEAATEAMSMAELIEEIDDDDDIDEDDEEDEDEEE